ncbi:MAG: tetratricopeptide repeat protein [Spirochaetes bacterium]|nr:tetratricopeptide repeat protein [Spirochaetota bacterium]MBN2769791.1 tetratricopeptide repeat protein [Spirochaetota bacterium]
MKKKSSHYIFFILILFFFNLYGQTVSELDNRAQRYYEAGEYERAIVDWITALEKSPGNKQIQHKVEMVYNRKRTRDLAFERSKKFLRIARTHLEKKEAQKSLDNADKSIENFITAYRITPRDPEMQILRARVERMRADALQELERQRLHAQMKKKYDAHYAAAQEFMENKEYENAITEWDAMLVIFADDNIAKEGKRKATLALQSRMRFEQIKRLTENGIRLFEETKYQESLHDFEEILKLDPGNPDAENYIAKIDDILEEEQKLERKRLQAERYYSSGLQNSSEYKFDQAREDYEMVISLIEDYQDAKSRLAGLDKLEEEYNERIRQQNLDKINRQFQAGLLYLAQGDYESAVTAFENIIEIDPANDQARRYVKTSKEALAQEKEDIIDESSPYFSLVSTLISSGKLYYERQEYRKSLDQWERILNLFPNNTFATEYLLKCQLKLNPDIYRKFAAEQIEEGKKMLKQKNYPRALRRFSIIKSISPDYPDIDNLIASAKPSKPQIPIPAGTPPPRITVSPAEIEQRYNRGIELYRNGDFKKALNEFKWVVKNDPQNTRAIINVNKIESEIRLSGNPARKRSATLSEEQKKLVRQYYFAGINYYSQNKFAEAVSEWRKVLAIDPNHDKARNNIRNCLLLMKQ